MTRAEQERLSAEFLEWANAEPQEQVRIEARWAAEHEERKPVVSIPASAENELRRIVGSGIEPSEALARMAEAGHHYERTGKRTAGLKSRAGVVSTGRGRGSLWRLA